LLDVTEQEERDQEFEAMKTKLEQQNERLDNFASVVGHGWQVVISECGTGRARFEITGVEFAE